MSHFHGAALLELEPPSYSLVFQFKLYVGLPTYQCELKGKKQKICHFQICVSGAKKEKKQTKEKLAWQLMSEG